MMKLETMSDLMLACSSEQGSPLLDDVICRWPYDQGSVRFFRVSANCVFTFQAAGQGYFLRVNRATERTVGAWQAEIAFMHELARKGLRIAAPVPSLAGNYVESAHTVCGELHAVVFQALPGRPCAEIADLSPALLTRWGKALGELHHAALGYQPADGRPTWQDHLAFIAEFLPRDDAAAWAVLEQTQSVLATLPRNEQNFGLIHYDFELDNIIWDGDRPGIIDFDDCSWYWFAADIAAALRDLFDDRADAIDYDNETFRTFIAGYRQAHDIDEDELRHLPLFLRMHNLTHYARLVRTLQTGKRSPEPAWMDGLREKLTRVVQRYRENFVRYASGWGQAPELHPVVHLR